MAQHVGYFEDNIEYKEGPFVVCDLDLTGAYRIESEMPGHHTSVYTHTSIYAIQKARGLWGNTRHRFEVDRVVDELNQMVRDDLIILVGRMWVTKEWAVAEGLTT